MGFSFGTTAFETSLPCRARLGCGRDGNFIAGFSVCVFILLPYFILDQIFFLKGFFLINRIIMNLDNFLYNRYIIINFLNNIFIFLNKIFIFF